MTLARGIADETMHVTGPMPALGDHDVIANLGFRDVPGGFSSRRVPLLERKLDKTINGPLTVPTRSRVRICRPRTRGLSLALAPASLEGGVVFHDTSFPVAKNPWSVRSGASRPLPFCLDDARVLRHYSEQIEQVRRGLHAPSGVLAARRQARWAFRSPDC